MKFRCTKPWSFFVLIAFTFGGLTTTSLCASAFMTTQESNEITPRGKYKIGFAPQYRTSQGSGFNFGGFFDVPVNEESSFRGLVGSGETDFFGGASFKWVPIPDYTNQPAVGAKVGAYYWRESDRNFSTLRVEPIVSKKFLTPSGTYIPYAAIPLMFNTGPDFNKTGMQVAIGSEYSHPEADNMTFGLELGLDAKDSFSYVSGYVTIYLDDQR